MEKKRHCMACGAPVSWETGSNTANQQRYQIKSIKLFYSAPKS